MKTIGRILGPLTLLEWGGILIYFYCSGRITAFLHPLFRPLVLLTGILLVLTAVCVAFFRDEDCYHLPDDDDHEHDLAEHERDQDHDSAHSHGGLTFGRSLAFLVLLIPLALAAKISPDNYGATLIANRGLVEDIRGLPGVKNRIAQSIGPSPTIVSRNSESAAGSMVSSTPTPVASASAAVKPEETSDSVALPANDPPQGNTEVIGDAVVTYENEFLKADKEGKIKAQVTDLLYAAQEPSTRKDFEGKRVELIGQFVAEKTRGRKAAPSVDPSTFHLMRLVMVCCAADMMPAAIKIQADRKPAQLREMSWLKISGIVHFRPRPKSVGDDGTNYGDYPEPVIVADKIASTPAPREKYIY
jgi:uncharacterized repeat protein (TIGR03943 family)